jgi:hypothetical protein
MTVGKASALAAGFVGALALGVAIGPTVQDKWSTRSTRDTVATEAAPAPARTAAPAAKTKSAPAEPRRARSSRPAPPGSVSRVAVEMWEPELRDRAKAVLNRGTRLEVAAEDFDTAEEFLTVAHAARNTSVPFMVLKRQVVNEGQSLADAIEQYKPELDAKAEVVLARSEARSDLTE